MAIRKPRKPKAAPRRPPSGSVRVRMYRQGFGDCFLVSLPRGRGRRDLRIMIDCGVLFGTEGAEATMQAVVRDIAAATKGTVDVLVVTHEHWDHLSGFLQAAEAMDAIRFGEVWMSWAEDPDDPQAKRLEQEQAAAVAPLRLAAARLGLAAGAEASPLPGLVGFLGAAGRSTREAMQAARARAAGGSPRYLEPGDPPIALAGTGSRVYVLGPPRQRKFLLRSRPSRTAPETYEFAARGFPLDEVAACLAGTAGQPFAPHWSIPLEVASGMPFFRRVFDSPDESWRGISQAWLDGLTELALKLDEHTNNSSLVLAIELANRDVLLFAADAQVGNWLSWQDLRWQVEGNEVTGPDLLARTVLYKVGHHGSHNATLREKGLETMRKLRTALMPVDEAAARRQGWDAIPLASLAARLDQVTGGRVLRSDAGRAEVPPAPGARDITATDLWFEVRLQGRSGPS